MLLQVQFNEKIRSFPYIQEVGKERKTGKIPCVILVRDGSIIPHAPLAQRTDEIRWDKLEMKTYRSASNIKCSGILFKPGDGGIKELKY